ncbi:MAG TPA: alpha-hydroxy acid oxidase [Solirubrobacteraceae bacterium]|nr:alpha-hydroxy acid oxidase [Solirubrobacteraceae bacterium]
MDREGAMLEELITLADCEAAARRRLPKHVYDYVAAGAADEITLARNRSAFGQLLLRPRFLKPVTAPELATTVLGTAISLPVVLSPAAYQRNLHPDGEVATCAGAARAATLAIVPAVTGERIEEVASAAEGPLWLQLYHRGRPTTESFAKRAEAAGYGALCVTVDIPAQNPRERDRRNWFLPPYEGVRFGLHDEAPVELRVPGYPFSVDDLHWLRERTRLPIVVKGVVTADDAALAVERGADGVFVSNHGARMLDTTPSAIEVLAEVVAAVDGRAEVYVDSGVRRGTDVLKALLLGARAVGIGRPWQWGLAVGGPAGVHRVLEILRLELEMAMTYCGQQSVQALTEGTLGIPSGWGPGTPAPAPQLSAG